MVVDQAPRPSADTVFRALSDPTRRDILHRTAGADLSVTELARAYPMSFAAVQKHVATLQETGLVSKTRRGREQVVRAEVGALGPARAALDELERLWRDRIIRMGELLADDTKE